MAPTFNLLVLPLRFDEFDHLNSSIPDVGHVLAMRVVAEETRGTDDHIDSVYALE